MSYSRYSTVRLTKQREKLLREFGKLPRRDSFSGWNLEAAYRASLYFASRIDSIDRVLHRRVWRTERKRGRNAD